MYAQQSRAELTGYLTVIQGLRGRPLMHLQYFQCMWVISLTGSVCTETDRGVLQFVSPVVFTRYRKTGTTLWRGVNWTDIQHMIQWTVVAIAHQAPFMVHVKLLCLEKAELKLFFITPPKSFGRKLCIIEIKYFPIL